MMIVIFLSVLAVANQLAARATTTTATATGCNNNDNIIIINSGGSNNLCRVPRSLARSPAS